VRPFLWPLWGQGSSTSQETALSWVDTRNLDLMFLLKYTYFLSLLTIAFLSSNLFLHSVSVSQDPLKLWRPKQNTTNSALAPWKRTWQLQPPSLIPICLKFQEWILQTGDQSEIHKAFRSVFVLCILFLTSNSILLNSFAKFILWLQVHAQSMVGAFNPIIKTS